MPGAGGAIVSGELRAIIARHKKEEITAPSGSDTFVGSWQIASEEAGAIGART